MSPLIRALIPVLWVCQLYTDHSSHHPVLRFNDLPEQVTELRETLTCAVCYIIKGMIKGAVDSQMKRDTESSGRVPSAGALSRGVGVCRLPGTWVVPGSSGWGFLWSLHHVDMIHELMSNPSPLSGKWG